MTTSDNFKLTTLYIDPFTRTDALRTYPSPTRTPFDPGLHRVYPWKWITLKYG